MASFLDHDHALEKGEEKILLEVSFPKKGLSFMQGRELAKQFVKTVDTGIGYACHYGNKFDISKRFTESNKLPAPEVE